MLILEKKSKISHDAILVGVKYILLANVKNMAILCELNFLVNTYYNCFNYK